MGKLCVVEEDVATVECVVGVRDLVGGWLDTWGDCEEEGDACGCCA